MTLRDTIGSLAYCSDADETNGSRIPGREARRPGSTRSCRYFEANPQRILERRDPVTLRPLLIIQGELDDNVLPAVQKKFAATYNAAGGDYQLHVFEGCEHEWGAKPGPQTDRAYEMAKSFIARNVPPGP